MEPRPLFFAAERIPAKIIVPECTIQVRIVHLLEFRELRVTTK
jgi:hypothetical protein